MKNELNSQHRHGRQQLIDQQSRALRHPPRTAVRAAESGHLACESKSTERVAQASAVSPRAASRGANQSRKCRH